MFTLLALNKVEGVEGSLSMDGMKRKQLLPGAKRENNEHDHKYPGKCVNEKAQRLTLCAAEIQQNGTT